MTTALWIAAVVAALAIGWALGKRGSSSPAPRDRSAEVLRALASDLAEGRRPTADPAGPDGMAEVERALTAHWAPRNEEREQALREALGRVAAFLREGVRDPLHDSLELDETARREAIETAIGAVQDLEFFLREPLTPDETWDLTSVVQQVTREFTQDWDIAVRFRTEPGAVRARIHRDTFMDAVYLLLHNAGQFGGEQTIDVEVKQVDGAAEVAIRDRGPGFTDEALQKAHDLFYTTTETGLGLGIPFARKIVESFGGSLELQNVDGGGALVRMLLPTA
ncbi:MAG: HAMP domain-containing sensor histidine kinase [Gemmatimonadota bacterium]|jgi:signal transduction histidine kinase